MVNKKHLKLSKLRILGAFLFCGRLLGNEALSFPRKIVCSAMSVLLPVLQYIAGLAVQYFADFLQCREADGFCFIVFQY